MPYHVQCPVSGVSAYPDCACPPTVDLVAIGGHLDGCPMGNLGALITCPPDSGCCQADHGPGGHDGAANACPGGHGDCPEPATCALWKPVKAHHAAVRDSLEHPEHRAAYEMPPDDCPGGHCHKALDDCTVCHPVVITAMPGSAVAYPVAAGRG